MKQRTFLTAEWKNLLMLNYAVEPPLLRSFVPAGTELDFLQGRTFISLIGFEFNRTRIAGIAVPFHSSFGEVNLRFYVKRGDRRGVAFIRELVPKRAVVAIARFAFGENYSCVPMSHRIHRSIQGEAVQAEYTWGATENQCSMRIETSGAASAPADGSVAQFISEHYWGYAMQADGGCIEYEVQHPRWPIREARSAQFSGDPTGYYGAEFASVLSRPPDSAFLAEGSAVTVFKGKKIEAAQIDTSVAP